MTQNINERPLYPSTKITSFRTLVKKIIEIIKYEIFYIPEYGGLHKYLQIKLHTALIHKPRMLYHSIRNYTKYRQVSNQNFSIEWELAKPLTLTYAFRSGDNYCPSCAKLEEEHGYDEKDLKHAEFIKFYERPIWSFNFKYYYTKCTCEDLLFEPLETWYATGGEQGSSLFTRSDAQWDINEELGWDSDPMKKHKKQLLPRGWRLNDKK